MKKTAIAQGASLCAAFADNACGLGDGNGPTSDSGGCACGYVAPRAIANAEGGLAWVISLGLGIIGHFACAGALRHVGHGDHSGACGHGRVSARCSQGRIIIF